MHRAFKDSARARLTAAVFLLGLAFCPPLCAADIEDADTASLPSLADLGIRGSLTFNHSSFFSKGPNEDDLFLEEGILEIGWTRELGSMFDVRLVAEARGDTAKFADGIHFQVPETDLNRSYLNLTEALLRFKYRNFDLTFGKQFYTWGTADIVNPTDYINPYDFLDVPQRYKMAVFSVSSNFVYGPFVYTAIIVPWFTPSRQPLLGSRWAVIPEDLTLVQDPQSLEIGQIVDRLREAIASGTPISIVRERQLPALDSVQFATRLRTTVAGWDLAVSYYDGFEHSPVLEEKVIVRRGKLFPGLRTLTPVFTRIRSAGFSFSTTYGQFEFHGEGVFQFVVSRGRNDLFKWIIGATYIDEVPIPWIDTIEATFEYARETVLRRVDSRFSPSFGFFSAGFRNALAGALRLSFSVDTRFRLAATVNLDGPASFFLQPSVSHRISDNVQLLTGFDVMSGSRDTFWGRWRDNDRWFMSLEYFF